MLWIILGDVNADCSYVSNSKYDELDLVTKDFTWELTKEADTTVTSTDCAYDNVISKSSNISDAGIYDFKEAFGLSQEKAEEVSNHYPVEFTLKIVP